MDPIETLHWLHGVLTNRLVVGPILIAKMRAQAEKALMVMNYHEKLQAMQNHIAQQSSPPQEADERPGKVSVSVGDGPGEQDEPYGFNQPSPE